MKIFQWLSCFLLSGIMISSLDGRIKELRNERHFVLKMEQTPFAVVLFYNEKNIDKEQQRSIRHLKRDLQYVVEAGLYQNAHVGLYAIDVCKEDLACVADKIGVTTYPMIILVKGTVPVKNKEGNIVVLKGFATRPAIRTFMDKHMRDDVLDFMQNKQDKMDMRSQLNRTNIYFSYGMTLPASVQYAYPYYYSPYYYYGSGAPIFGMEMGF